MSDSLQTWIDAGERSDAELAGSALATEATLVSPVTDQFVFSGAEQIVTLLQDVFEIVTDIHYVRVDRTATGAALQSEAHVDGVAMQEAQFVDLDAEGLITGLTLFFRPLPAATRFLRLLGPRVARRQGNPGTARTLRFAGGFLDAVASSGDRKFIPMAAPRSRRD